MFWKKKIKKIPDSINPVGSQKIYIYLVCFIFKNGFYRAKNLAKPSICMDDYCHLV
jgi:hypothetical protein